MLNRYISFHPFRSIICPWNESSVAPFRKRNIKMAFLRQGTMFSVQLKQVLSDSNNFPFQQMLPCFCKFDSFVWIRSNDRWFPQCLFGTLFFGVSELHRSINSPQLSWPVVRPFTLHDIVVYLADGWPAGNGRRFVCQHADDSTFPRRLFLGFSPAQGNGSYGSRGVSALLAYCQTSTKRQWQQSSV